jgi:hypothetical protein
MSKRLLFLLVGMLTISAPCFAQTPPPMPATPSDDDLIKSDVDINHAARSKALIPTPSGNCRWC